MILRFHSVEGCTNNDYWNAYKEVNLVLLISAYNCVFKYQLLISTLMNILAARVFGRVKTAFLIKIESKWADNLPLSTKWL